ncbi:hypothetical protein PV797_10580 [Clostridiaceae bacterium M8S5]|nr:hypothetical protein PV797_10580 [Clostridiaceae bacterium M8S5]
MIWFEEGPFIELFTFNLSFSAKFVLGGILKLLRKEALLNRFNLYGTSTEAFCDMSIETHERELTTWTQLISDQNYTYDKMTGRRINVKGEKLDWQLAVPKNIKLPFLMSAYNIPQRPSKIQHPNGAKSIRKVVYGTSAPCQELINMLTKDDLILQDDKGIIDVIIDGWDHTLLHFSNYKI